ncbi:uncharacterized protein LOC106661176 isoform X2 [Cimex lectularius]|nr:uncharacterized protein LOC106661176 isoform X2 [Cimex lectularius]
MDVGWVRGTCVFNSDFGFTLNCNFKKSSILRVRNLGGVKGYVGLGFSVGDELAFAEALSNTDPDKRRSTNDGDKAFAAKQGNQGEGRSNSGRNPLLAWTSAGGMAGGVPGALPGVMPGMVPGVIALSPPIPTVPPFKPLGTAKNNSAPVPPFSALPPSIARIPTITRPQASTQMPLYQLANSNNMVPQVANRRYQIASPSATEVPLKNSIVVGKVIEPIQQQSKMTAHTLALRTLNSKPKSTSPPKIYDIDITSPTPLLMGHSVQSLSKASNISIETLAAALKLREQQLLASLTSTTTTSSTTTTTTTTPRPTRPATVRPRYPLVGPNRVMNAPKEYYPVSYDKNYDDNFTSKVELPDTSFSCGDQKHFPGLYADEDLGCMVFHVCAFTDDGMVMKSFLCPESTLFDQSILKCNWWFYVDCKSSNKLYDSNIPISKSYQLMKALAFFSGYKNQTSTNSA